MCFGVATSDNRWIWTMDNSWCLPNKEIAHFFDAFARLCRFAWSSISKRWEIFDVDRSSENFGSNVDSRWRTLPRIIRRSTESPRKIPFRRAEVRLFPSLPSDASTCLESASLFRISFGRIVGSKFLWFCSSWWFPDSQSSPSTLFVSRSFRFAFLGKDVGCGSSDPYRFLTKGQQWIDFQGHCQVQINSWTRKPQSYLCQTNLLSKSLPSASLRIFIWSRHISLNSMVQRCLSVCSGTDDDDCLNVHSSVAAFGCVQSSESFTCQWESDHREFVPSTMRQKFVERRTRKQGQMKIRQEEIVVIDDMLRFIDNYQPKGSGTSISPSPSRRRRRRRSEQMVNHISLTFLIVCFFFPRSFRRVVVERFSVQCFSVDSSSGRFLFSFGKPSILCHWFAIGHRKQSSAEQTRNIARSSLFPTGHFAHFHLANDSTFEPFASIASLASVQWNVHIEHWRSDDDAEFEYFFERTNDNSEIFFQSFISPSSCFFILRHSHFQLLDILFKDLFPHSAHWTLTETMFFIARRSKKIWSFSARITLRWRIISVCLCSILIFISLIKYTMIPPSSFSSCSKKKVTRWISDDPITRHTNKMNVAFRLHRMITTKTKKFDTRPKRMFVHLLFPHRRQSRWSKPVHRTEHRLWSFHFFDRVSPKSSPPPCNTFIVRRALETNDRVNPQVNDYFNRSPRLPNQKRLKRGGTNTFLQFTQSLARSVPRQFQSKEKTNEKEKRIVSLIVWREPDLKRRFRSGEISLCRTILLLLLFLHSLRHFLRSRSWRCCRGRRRRRRNRRGSSRLFNDDSFVSRCTPSSNRQIFPHRMDANEQWHRSNLAHSTNDSINTFLFFFFSAHPSIPMGPHLLFSHRISKYFLFSLFSCVTLITSSYLIRESWWHSHLAVDLILVIGQIHRTEDLQRNECQLVMSRETIEVDRIPHPAGWSISNGSNEHRAKEQSFSPVDLRQICFDLHSVDLPSNTHTDLQWPLDTLSFPFFKQSNPMTKAKLIREKVEQFDRKQSAWSMRLQSANSFAKNNSLSPFREFKLRSCWCWTSPRCFDDVSFSLSQWANGRKHRWCHSAHTRGERKWLVRTRKCPPATVSSLRDKENLSILTRDESFVWVSPSNIVDGEEKKKKKKVASWCLLGRIVWIGKMEVWWKESSMEMIRYCLTKRTFTPKSPRPSFVRSFLSMIWRSCCTIEHRIGFSLHNRSRRRGSLFSFLLFFITNRLVRSSSSWTLLSLHHCRSECDLFDRIDLSAHLNWSQRNVSSPID